MSTAAGEVPQEKEQAGTAEVPLPKVGEETGRNVCEPEGGGGGLSSPLTRLRDQLTFFAVALERKSDLIEAGTEVSVPASGDGSVGKTSEAQRPSRGNDAALVCAPSPQEQGGERRSVSVVVQSQVRRKATTANTPDVEHREDASYKSERKRMRTKSSSEEFDGVQPESDGGDPATRVTLQKVREFGHELVQAFSGSNIGMVQVNINFFPM